MALKWNNPRAFLVRHSQSIVDEITREIDSGVRFEMSLPKKGRRYKRKRGTHTASAAGEAPAIDSRHYLSNIGIYPKTKSLVKYIGVKNTPYAGALEDPQVMNRPVWVVVARRVIGRYQGKRK
jgi:hypothetical protein